MIIIRLSVRWVDRMRQLGLNGDDAKCWGKIGNTEDFFAITEYKRFFPLNRTYCALL